MKLNTTTDTLQITVNDEVMMYLRAQASALEKQAQLFEELGELPDRSAFCREVASRLVGIALRVLAETPSPASTPSSQLPGGQNE